MGDRGLLRPVLSAVFRVRNEVLQGAVNGSNKVFTTANVFVVSSLAVYLNGLRQEPGLDYSVSGTSEITFVDPPQTSLGGTDRVMADYDVS